MIKVFGSLNADLVARVARIPRPGETVLSEGYDVVPGGKGANQALAARRAGAEVAFVGCRGEDGFAGPATALLLEAGVDLSGLSVVDRPTGIALITVEESGENAIVVAAGANAATHIGQLERAALQPGDTLLLQREIADEATFAAIGLAKARRARAVLNVAPAGRVPEAALRDLYGLVVNEHEALVVAEGAGLRARDPEEAVAALHRSFGCLCVVTLGARGAVGWQGGERICAPALRVAVVDTTAAGDSFVGAFAAALEAGLDGSQALRRGVVAGSLACTKPGAQPSIPTAAEIERALRDLNG